LFTFLQAATGVLTLCGGLTSYAAVNMRAAGKAAVTCTQNMFIGSSQQFFTTSLNGGRTVRKGDVITLDGSTGHVYVGEIATVNMGLDDNFLMVMQWADKYKRMSIYADTNNLKDVQQAVRMGAEGIGECRTEYMFFKPSSIDIFRQLILLSTAAATATVGCSQAGTSAAADVAASYYAADAAKAEAERNACLRELIPLHQADFLEVFRTVGSRKVTMRLLDQPLYEFFPSPSSATFTQEIASLAQRMQIDPVECKQRVLAVQETNPMLGFRGARLSVAYPAITEMQTRAIVGSFSLLYKFICSDPIELSCVFAHTMRFHCIFEILMQCVGIVGFSTLCYSSPFSLILISQVPWWRPVSKALTSYRK
jgi:pyruvate, orthophosphate dikinase